MKQKSSRKAPGKVRDAILQVMSHSGRPLSVKEVTDRVCEAIGPTPTSSVRSYLGINSDGMFIREGRGLYCLRSSDYGGIQREFSNGEVPRRSVAFDKGVLYEGDCFDWLSGREDFSLHAVVTDPPYGLHEYTQEQQSKLRAGKGGVWRIPPAFDGHQRSPLPRFTTLSQGQLVELRDFFHLWGRLLLPKLVPGANVLVASNPLVSHIVAAALSDAGLERRGEIIRLTMTMRGGDRPKAAHDEFREVSVMPRSMWEPWLAFRKPIEGRVQDNLRTWKTGGFRRPGPDKPFGDVIRSAPTRREERALGQHPSLKPQAFMRQVVRASLPLGEGTVLDPFAGAGSTLAAAEAVGYASIGIEKDPGYFEIARAAVPKLANYVVKGFERDETPNSRAVS